MQESSTRKIYDIQSMFYDATFGRLVRRRVERAIHHMNISDQDLVLDLGIGTGASLNYYPDRGRIIGVDLSAGMLREARKKIRERHMERTILFQANALELPFGDNTFDTVFVSHVISVVSDPAKVVREAQRVAKPGADCHAQPFPEHESIHRAFGKVALSALHQARLAERPGVAGSDPPHGAGH